MAPPGVGVTSPYLICGPEDTPTGCGILDDPALIDAQFGERLDEGRWASCYHRGFCEALPMGISLALIFWNSLRLRGLSKLLGPDAVFSAGRAGVSSVEVWLSICLDIEEMLSDARQDALHVLCNCCHQVIRHGGQEHFGLCVVSCWVAWWFRRDYVAYHGQGRHGTGLGGFLGHEMEVFLNGAL